MNDNSTSVETTRVNRLSDHEFLLALAYINQQGQTEYGFPPYDWELKFYTSSPLNFYTVSCRGGVMLNCQREGDMVRIIMDGHKLSTGVLRARSTIYIPDSNFPDGTRRVVDEHEFKTLFVSGHGTLASGPQLELLFPYVKGEPGKPFTYDDFTPEQLEGLRGPQGKSLTYDDLTPEQIEELRGPKGEPFTYDDFTPEQLERLRGPQGNSLTYDDLTPGQIAELQRPATEAAQLVSSAIDAATATNNAITEAEQTRVEAEQSRVKAEQERVETEQSRVEAERSRVEAEQSRAREFAGFAQAIDKGTIKCFIDKWDAAWKVNDVVYGKYDPDNAPDSEHPFLGNKIWMTYEEALTVYERTNINGFQYSYRFNYETKIRTTLPIKIPLESQGRVDTTGMFYNCYNLETFMCYRPTVAAVWTTIKASNCNGMFYGCRKLREILTPIQLTDYPIKFQECAALEWVVFWQLSQNVDLRDSPLIRTDALAKTVADAANTSATTITLHPDAYARVTDDIFAAAAAKNITIATP